MLNFYPPFLYRVLAAILKMADIVDPKVFRFVVKGDKAIFLGVQRGRGLL
jgi:hypothetical protein